MFCFAFAGRRNLRLPSFCLLFSGLFPFLRTIPLCAVSNFLQAHSQTTLPTEKLLLIGAKIIKRVVPQTADFRQAEFETLWQQHRARVWRLVARLAGNPDLADDLTQEVSLRAFQAFGSFRGQSDAFTWLYRIAVNVVLRDRERRKPTLAMDSPLVACLSAPDTHDPEQAALRAEIQPRVWAALNCLPDDLRATLILQVYEGLKYREIAQVLDIPIGTVKSRLNNAMQRLREELKDYAL